jgi:hypothetical protein
LRGTFVDIYDRNVWKWGSGKGSLPIHTAGYRAFLEQFLVRNRIASVVDMGCGDWQFSRLVDWGDVSYRGFDVVPSLIAENTRRFAKPGISFELASGDPSTLPPADLLLAKDVLQHLPHEAVFAFLANVQRYRYALVTNGVDPRGPTQNIDISIGHCRHLDLRLPPFNVDAEEVYSFCKVESRLVGMVRGWLERPAWKKVVLLLGTEPPAWPSAIRTASS